MLCTPVGAVGALPNASLHIGLDTIQVSRKHDSLLTAKARGLDLETSIQEYVVVDSGSPISMQFLVVADCCIIDSIRQSRQSLFHSDNQTCFTRSLDAAQVH
jgi:hypothetical protein